MRSHPESGSGEEAEPTLDLLTRARDGDQDAWQRLYARYSDELRRRVHARLGPELRGAEESLDVFQSIWREAIGSLQHFEYRGEGSFLAWLAAVLRHKLAHKAERLRAAKRGGGVPPLSGSVAAEIVAARPAPEPGPATQVERAEDRELLRRAMQQLPPDQQELVRWSLFEGLSHGDVADRLGVGADAARMRVARATAKLTAEFQRLFGDAPAEDSAGDP